MTVPATLQEYEAIYGNQELDWFRVTGSPKFDYPIDYSVAILSVDEDSGRTDFVSRWESNCYCHYHRHVGETSVLVLEGEHHVVEESPNQTTHKIRKPGFFITNPGGDLHMEYGGPDGSLVYFSCHAEQGKLFDVLDADGNVLNTATVDDFTGGKIKGAKSAQA